MSTAFPLALLAPAFLLAAALAMSRQPGLRPARVAWLPEGASLVALAIAALSTLQVIAWGPARLTILDGAFALGLRADAISATMTLLVAFIGWIVIRYSRTYLDGEAREGRFHALMLATLAAVLLLAQAGSLVTLILAFVAAGLGLRQLLLFYPDRPAARRAATKFALVWHAGDVALVLAAILLAATFGTTDFAALSTDRKSVV